MRLRSARSFIHKAARGVAQFFESRGPINPEVVIDRVFRTIEMLLVSVLIGVLGSVVGNTVLLALMYILQYAAGLYIGIPLARWLAPPTRALMITLAMLMSTQMVILADPLVTLAKAAIDVDVQEARRSYDEVLRRQHHYACSRSGITPEECDARMRYD